MGPRGIPGERAGSHSASRDNIPNVESRGMPLDAAVGPYWQTHDTPTGGCRISRELPWSHKIDENVAQ